MNIQPLVASLPPQQGNPPDSRSTRETRAEVKAASETKLKTVDPTLSAQAMQSPDRAELEAATKSVRDFVEPINSNLEFNVDHDTGEMVVKVIDRASGK